MPARAGDLEQIVIRAMAMSDANQAAQLSAELGYEASGQEIANRLEVLLTLDEHAVFVACLDDKVVGWIDVGIVYHLQSAPYGEIGGLVVSEKHRGSGIGSKLVDEAETWIASKGVGIVVVRSRSTRERAHKFYIGRDYSLWKTSVVFTKQLAGQPRSG